MLHHPKIGPDGIADEWAIRSEFWQAVASKSTPRRKVRERNSRPLVLTGHGTSLRIENGALSIKQGFTHYPQKAEQFRFFKGDLKLPRLIMLLDGSGSISFDVLSWLGEQAVALARIQWGGEPAVFASGAGFVANSDNLRWQYETQANEQLRLEFGRKLICEKLANSLATLGGQNPRKLISGKGYRQNPRRLGITADHSAFEHERYPSHRRRMRRPLFRGLAGPSDAMDQGEPLSRAR